MGTRNSFSGKVAIVTGGASGIGKALGVELSKRGAEVVLADRQLEAATNVAKGIVESGGAARAVELDVRDLDAFEALAQDTLSRSGHIDYFFNNAGIGIGGEMDAFDKQDWDDIIDVNLRGVAYGIQAIYPKMVKQGSGHIINTASMLGLVPGGGEGGYTATKHAVVGLSKALRVEARRHGVKASVLCPGAIRTPILTGGVFGRLKLAIPEEVMMKMWETVRPMDPDVFAPKVLDQVLKNVAYIIVPSWWKVLWYIDRLAPSLSITLWTRIFDKMRADLEAATKP